MGKAIHRLRRSRVGYRRKAAIALTLLLCMSAADRLATAAPADLDPTFGNHGAALLPDLPTFPTAPGFGETYIYPEILAIAVQADGKILAGISVASCIIGPLGGGCVPGYAAVARYNPDGSVDGAFGTNGVATGPISAGSNLVAFLLQDDGKILLAMPNKLLRLGVDGHPDPTFGYQGTVTAPTSVDPVYYPNAIVQQSDGKLLVALIGSHAGDASGVARLNGDGSIDATYGTGGIAPLAFSTALQAPAMTIQPDGKLLVVATAQQSSATFTSLFAQRLNLNGSLDAAFGQSGIASIPFTDTAPRFVPISIPLSVFVLTNGQLIITGMQNGPADQVGQLALLQLNADGTLDSSFGTTGRTVFPAIAALDRASSVRQTDGKIIFGGRTLGFVSPSMFVTRLNPDGSVDPAFGSCGTQQTSTNILLGTSPLGIGPEPIALQPDRKILSTAVLAIPSTLGTTLQPALLRLQGGESTVAYIASGNNPAPLGAAVNIDAQVVPVASPPAGTVTFNDGVTAIQGCVALPLVATSAQAAMGLSSFGATCQVQTLAPGAHTLSATFSGDSVNPATTSCPLTQFVDPPGQLTATEYYHDVFDNYFVTSLADEVSALDQHRFQGWRRTGLHFAVHPLDQLAESASVCRFFSGQSFAPKSSHFFTPVASECAAVMQEPQWLFEGLVFGLTLPDDQGNCGPGSEPLYRLYNDGQGGAPNHRFLTDKGLRDRMMESFGWVPEGFGTGVIACTQ